MNKRSKSENSSVSTPAKRTPRTRSITKKITTKPQRKRNESSIVRNRYADDDDFQPRSKRPVRKKKPIIAYPPMEVTSPRKFSQRVYEISDTSDDETTYVLNNVISIGSSDTSQANEVIVLDESISYPSTSSETIMLNNIDTLPIVNAPSTFEASASSIPTNSNGSDENILEFIDTLLQTNSDTNILKTVRELNEETDKLLASSRELINDSTISTEDSVVYVCTNKDPMKQIKNQDTGTVTSAAAVENVAQEKQMKAHCPICLDNLGTTPVSSTVCGHAFCTACIKNCIKATKHCPTCRKYLTQKMVHPLFLF